MLFRSVRARALRELCEEDGDLGARTAAFLLPDEVPVVRLQAALLLGDRAAVRAAPDEARRSLLRDHPDTLLAMEELGDEDGLVAGLSEGGTTLLAAEALGRIGTPRSLPALEAANRALGRPGAAARAAIVAIRARREVAQDGRLSLGEGGDLSVADVTGRVSRPER